MKQYRLTSIPVFLLAGSLTVGSLIAQPSVVITEIMYNPVEEPVFDLDGTPVFDLSENIHEYIELFNSGGTIVSLADWRLSGGITFDFPPSAAIQPGAYLVVAKDKLQLAAVHEYGLVEGDLLGPYEGQLSNTGETIRLRDQSGDIVDEVTYSAGFPWSISADSLGAGDRWTGLNSIDYQYRGRSLERVSLTWDAKDPANWLASPLPGEPSPGRANAVSRPIPMPVVVRFSVAQEADGQLLIRSNQSVRIDCTFSGTNDLSDVSLEYFVDELNQVDEVTIHRQMTDLGQGSYTAVLPSRPQRSLVRYRFRANRGAGEEVVSPRADDPFGWHAYFVTPDRASTTDDIYDLFISNDSLAILAANFSDNPRRSYIPAPGVEANGRWNDEVPAVFVNNGVVRDVVCRYNGSYYRRSVGRQSYKVVLPRYHPLRGRRTLLVTDKNHRTWSGFAIFREVGFPASETRWVDLYVNDNPVRRRMEFDDVDAEFFERYHKKQAELNPEQPEELPGRAYKSSGIGEDAGPYWTGNGRPLPDKLYWTSLDRYSWVYSLKSQKWRGFVPFKTLVDDMAAARGHQGADPIPGVGPANYESLRAFGQEAFDVDSAMTFLATRNWQGVRDDGVHNYYLWQKSNGKYSLLPWDFDADGVNQNSANESGGSIWSRNNLFKDNLLHAFREEYRQRLFFLNNTVLHPDNIAAIGLPTYRTWATARQQIVNQQLGLGPFLQPTRPINLAPPSGELVLAAGSLRSSEYRHPSGAGTAPHVSTTWRIRSANGTYSDPIYTVTTPGPVTSIPLPFDSLKFGEVYYWQCFHNDVNGHPSPPSDETPFAFGFSNDQSMDIVTIDSTTRWRYDNTNAAPSVDWNQPEFDDGAWRSGPALLGVEFTSLAQPIRTGLSLLNQGTFYFRTHFDFPHDPANVILQLSHFIDDGAIFYLNGEEVWRTRMPEGPANNDTLASEVVDNAVLEGPFTIPESSLRRGDNVLAVEVHQATTSETDVVFGLSLGVTLPASSGNVVLNEILADNSTAVTNGGSTPDWVEFYNKSDNPVDLAGLSLTDDPFTPRKFIFPPNSVVPANGFLVVWCDDDVAAPGIHAGFSISAEGESLSLIEQTADGLFIRDTISFGAQAADLSIGRTPDGFGPWQLNVPTPGGPNEHQPLGSQSDLVINEWMANPDSGDDWLELHNPASLPVSLSGLHLTCNFDYPANTRLPDLSFVAAGGFTLLFGGGPNSSNPSDLNFNLRSSGETLWMFAADATFLLDSVQFGVQTRGVSQGRFPDTSRNFAFFPNSPSPKASNRQYELLTTIQINEVLAHNDADPPIATEFEGAIELRNTSTVSINVGHWWLSDDPDEPKKYSIPDPTVIAPGQFHVVYENAFNATPGSPTSFALDAGDGGTVVLSAADATGTLTSARTSVVYGPSASDISFGQIQTSIGTDFTALQQPTFGVNAPTSVEQFRTGTGAPNAPPLVGPVVISEIHYQPKPGEAAYIELQNISTGVVPLFDAAEPANTWRLNGVGYTFPTDLMLSPDQRLLIVQIDPEEFRTQYGIPAEVLVLGPYPGLLQTTGERLELQRPGAPDPLDLEYITVDTVEFDDRKPWPTPPAGTGASLQRQPIDGYGNDPANWTAAGPTPGEVLLNGDAPQITLNPLPFDVQEGIEVTLFGSATGTGLLQYQWQFNGANIPGADSNVLQLTNVSDANIGFYTLVAFDDLGFAISEPAAGIVRPAPKILAHPLSQRVPPGETAYFRINARGTGGVRYQWYLYGAPIVGATEPTLTVTNVQLTSAGDYTATVTDAVGTVFSDIATLVALVRPAFIEHPQSQTVFVGQDLTLHANVAPSHPSLPVGYRWRRNGRTVIRDGLSWGSGSLTLTNVQLTEDGARYTVVATNAGNFSPGILSRTARLTVLEIVDADGDQLPDDWESANELDPANPADAHQDLDGDGLTSTEEFKAGTDPNDPDSFLAIESVDTELGGVNIRFNALSNINYTVEWREGLQLGEWSKLQDYTQSTQLVQQVTLTDTQPVAEGRVYRLVTPRQLNPQPGPVIFRSPQPLVVDIGDEAFFDVDVTGTGAMTFQWSVGGQWITGATESSLTISNAQLSDAGAYSVQITDHLGQTTNAVPAILTVNPSP